MFNNSSGDSSGIITVTTTKTIPDPIGKQLFRSQFSCTLNICSGLGQPCSKRTDFSGFQCYIDSRCLNDVCVPSLKPGEECFDSSECLLGYSCVTQLSGLSSTISPNKTKTCERAYFADYGESCTRATDCLNSLDCLNGVCSTPQYGCLSDLSCAKGSICVNKICTPYQLNENECFFFQSFPCNNTQNPCALKDFNVSSIGICKNKIEQGSPCLTTKYSCDWFESQFCKPIKEGSIIGKCTRSPPSSLGACISQSDCGFGEFCKCDSQSGVGYCSSSSSFQGKFCKRAVTLFLDCFKGINCSFPFSSNPTSCISQSICKKEAECLSLYCSEPLLPISLCAYRDCSLTLFHDDTVRTISTNSGSSNIIINYQLLLLLLLLFYGNTLINHTLINHTP